MCKKCLILLLAGTMVCSAGCKGNEKAPEVNEVGIQTEENETESTDQEVEIELPEEEIAEIDYTTAAELRLPAGTRIAVVAKNVKGDYWQAVRIGMQKAVDDLNTESGLTDDNQIVMTFEGPDESDDAETQINTIDAVLSENPQVLCLSAIDMTSCEAQLEMATENGIPVIMFDSSVKSDDLVYTVCKTDNYAAGGEAAKQMVAKTGDEGSLLIVALSKDTESILDRVLGFKDEIVNGCETMEVAETIYADEESELSLQERIAAAIEENPDIKGCFATDEMTAKEVLELFKDSKYQGIQFVGFDAGAGQTDAIRDGKELGMICQNPYGMGYATIISAARSILGLENDKIINAGYQWIDIDNIDLEENQKYLYERG